MTEIIVSYDILPLGLYSIVIETDAAGTKRINLKTPNNRVHSGPNSPYLELTGAKNDLLDIITEDLRNMITDYERKIKNANSALKCLTTDFHILDKFQIND